MTKMQKAIWWVYVVSGVILVFFLAPALISAADTFAVLFGVLLLVLFVLWTWHLWAKSLASKIKGAISQ